MNCGWDKDVLEWGRVHCGQGRAVLEQGKSVLWTRQGCPGAREKSALVDMAGLPTRSEGRVYCGWCHPGGG